MQNPVDVPENTKAVPLSGGGAPPQGTSGTAAPGDAPKQAPPDGGGILGGMLPMILLMFGLMYFLILRPEKKRQKALAQLRDSVKKGDRVATTSGILGTVASISDDVVTIEVADKVRVQFQRSAISQVLESKERAETAATT